MVFLRSASAREISMWQPHEWEELSIDYITTGVRVQASVPELGSELHSLNCGCRRNKHATKIARDGAGHGGSIKYYIVSRKCTDDITRFGTKHSHSSSKMKARPTCRRHLCSQRTILRRPMIEKTKSRGYYHGLLFWNAVNINKLEEHRRKHHIGAGSKDRRPFWNSFEGFGDLKMPCMTIGAEKNKYALVTC